MSTTTLTAFWDGFATTVWETVTGNYMFFAYVFASVLVLMLLGGIGYGLTSFFKGKRKWKK